MQDRGDVETNEVAKRRAEAGKARQLAEDARRVAELMHQVQVRRDLLDQAATLKRRAEALETPTGEPG